VADYQAGLDDQDELSQFPSAASPLAAMGIDPDVVRANPAMLDALRNGERPQPPAQEPAPGPMKMPTGEDAPVSFSTGQPVATPSAAAAGAVGGAGDAEPADTEGYEKAGLSNLYRNSQLATKAAQDISTTPPAEVSRLTTQRDKLAVPAPLFDPKTGKRLSTTQEYDPQTGQMVDVNAAPSVGSRIWRGVRSGIVGLTTGGIPGLIRGVIEPDSVPGGQAYGAPALAYQRAEQRREQELGATDTDLNTAFKTWKDAVDAAKAKAGEFRANATIGKDLTSSAAASTKNVIDQYKAEATAENYHTKADEAEKKLQEQMQKDLMSAQNNSDRIAVLRDNAQLHDQIQRMQLDLANKKLETVTDAKTVDQWQKEQIDSIDKDYTGIMSSLWNRITAGSKQDRIAEINKAADSRRAALGLGSGAGTSGQAVTTKSAPPAGATHTAPGSDGKMHYATADGRDLGVVPQ
jgi:hypothetical protein